MPATNKQMHIAIPLLLNLAQNLLKHERLPFNLFHPLSVVRGLMNSEPN